MSSPDALLPYRELMDQLLGLCIEKRSGTALIATDDNHLARVVIEHGTITYLNYRLKKGEAAIPLIRQINAGRLKFSQGKLGPHDEGRLPAGADGLQLLTGSGSPPKSGKQAPASISVSRIEAAMKIIERELIEFLGPMGSIVIAELLNNVGGPPKSASKLKELVDKVAKEIGDPAKIANFKEQVWSKIRGDMS